MGRREGDVLGRESVVVVGSVAPGLFPNVLVGGAAVFDWGRRIGSGGGAWGETEGGGLEMWCRGFGVGEG